MCGCASLQMPSCTARPSATSHVSHCFFLALRKPLHPILKNNTHGAARLYESSRASVRVQTCHMSMHIHVCARTRTILQRMCAMVPAGCEGTRPVLKSGSSMLRFHVSDVAAREVDDIVFNDKADANTAFGALTAPEYAFGPPSKYFFSLEKDPRAWMRRRATC